MAWQAEGCDRSVWLFTGLDRSTSSQAGHAPFPGALMESRELIPLPRQDPISCCPPCCCRWEAAVLGWLWFRLLCSCLVGDGWDNPSKPSRDWWRVLCCDEGCAQPCAHWDPLAVTVALVSLPSSCRPNIQEALAAPLVLLSGSWHQPLPLCHLHGGLGVDRGGLFLQRRPHVAYLRDIQLPGILLGLGAPEGKDNKREDTSTYLSVCTY